LTLYRHKKLALPALVLAGLGAVAVPLWAQQTTNAPRGIQLRFGVALGLQSQSNRGLDVSNPGGSSEASMDLSLGVLSETRTQRFSFDLGGTLRNISGPSSASSGFVTPSAAISYDRNSASARLSLSATMREAELGDNSFDFDTATSETTDFTFVDGTATRRTTNLSARLDWRDDAPLGFGVFARLNDNSYRGGTATGIDGSSLNDSQRLTLGVSARFDINEATRLNTSLSYGRFEENGVAGSRGTWTLNNDLTIDQRDGGMTFGFDITDTEDGTRVAADVGRSLEYPLGIVSGRLGITRGVSGDHFLTGGLRLTRALPRGNLNFDLSRDITSGSLEDNEQVNTTLRVSYLHELSPVASLNLSANWAEADQTSTGIETSSASITATYRRELSPDWGMNVGLRHRFQDDGRNGSARSNELFLNLRRDFLTRF